MNSFLDKKELSGTCDYCNKFLYVGDKCKLLKSYIINCKGIFNLQYCNDECLQKAKEKYDNLNNLDFEEVILKDPRDNSIRKIIMELINNFPQFVLINSEPKNAALIIKNIMEIHNSKNITDDEQEFYNFCKNNLIIY